MRQSAVSGFGTRQRISKKYCPRFGMVAVEMGFISEKQLIEALGYQVYEEFQGFGHRLLGAILFDKGWMTSKEVDWVATVLLRRMRGESYVPVKARKAEPTPTPTPLNLFL
jgi:hypothetical protein